MASSLTTTPSLQGRVVQAAFNRDCDEELAACEGMCLAGLRGDDWSHMSKGSKKEHCRRVCRQPYLDCCRVLLLVPVVTLASSEVASEPRALAVTP